MAELQHPFPPASLSGEGLEGGVAAVSFRRDVACYVCSLSAALDAAPKPGAAPDVASNVSLKPPIL